MNALTIASVVLIIAGLFGIPSLVYRLFLKGHGRHTGGRSTDTRYHIDYDDDAIAAYLAEFPEEHTRYDITERGLAALGEK